VGSPDPAAAARGEAGFGGGSLFSLPNGVDPSVANGVACAPAADWATARGWAHYTCP
jgi:hypothetical protein